MRSRKHKSKAVRRVRVGRKLGARRQPPSKVLAFVFAAAAGVLLGPLPVVYSASGSPQHMEQVQDNESASD